MTNGAPGALSALISDSVIKGLGGFALALIFMVGAYFFLIKMITADSARLVSDREYEHKRFIARQSREARLITLMESQHKALQVAALSKLEKQETTLDQLSKHADLMSPLMTRLRHWLDGQGTAQQDGIVRGARPAPLQTIPRSATP